ncbi:MAG: hypothetical protein AAGJ10_20435 [Bacteroidota bacterium]
MAFPLWTRHSHMRVAPLLTFVLLTAACIPAQSHGQVDPSWLRSWNEAQETRPKKLTSSSRIAAVNEPGAPLIVSGQVFEPDGTPAQSVVVHAYHRDANGFDFGPDDSSLTTWRLQGWVKTDAAGRFDFATIRPAPDHLGREGGHIHFTTESKAYGRQWAPKVFFADDPMLTDEQHQRSAEAGRFAWIREVETTNDIQRISVAIQLKKESDF